MSGMAGGDPAVVIWNWSVAGRLDAAKVRSAISGVLDRPVTGLGGHTEQHTQNDALLCDVFHVGGEFPTVIDTYLAPAGREAEVASAVAVRLGAAVLFPDETLNPTRYVLAGADGSLRAVHADGAETDEGTEHSNVRPCTGADPACAVAPERRAA